MQAYSFDTTRGGSTISAHSEAHEPAPPVEIVTSWATSYADIEKAQRLRHDVFVREMGATSSLRECNGNGYESDRFDPYCDHLLVKTRCGWQQQPEQVIGTYRVLRPDQAIRAGGFYSDTEFDLAPINALRAGALELGRTCVHPAWRTGLVIMMMWRALGQYMQMHQLDTMIGCASIGLGDEGYAAAIIWERLRHLHLAAEIWQVSPREALPIDFLLAKCEPQMPSELVATPPLIKGYLRCGARLLGPPARDTLFNTADLPMMLRFNELTSRYRKHFLGC